MSEVTTTADTPPSASPSTAPAAPARTRVASVDLIRGAVMVLMAIDHVRVYSGLPAGGPSPGIFFTRWVTHFCAPAFIFLAGTSAFFYGASRSGLSRLLLARGAWLILLELTVLKLAWTFSFEFFTRQMAGVIWVIGWCMIAMAGLVKLPIRVIAGFGLLVVAGHNLLDPVVTGLPGVTEGPLAALWKLLYSGFFGGPIPLGGDASFVVLYAFLPWVGVMALGYAFGAILTKPAAERDRACLTIGVGAIVAFVVLRATGLYGDPRTWAGLAAPGPDGGGMPSLLAFLNATKYPASLQFQLMTLGPCIALVPLLERMRRLSSSWVSVFGRVPFFYYMLHIPLIHALALVVSAATTGQVDPWLFQNHPMGNPPPPEGYPWSLGTLYLVFAISIVILYPLCRWYAGFKARRSEWWLRLL